MPRRSRLYLFDSLNGRFNPHVYGFISKVDNASSRRVFTVDYDTKIPVRYVCEGRAV